MTLSSASPRRGFLGRMAAAAVAAVVPWTMPSKLRAAARTQGVGPDDWAEGLNGTYRCFFPFRSHDRGFPLFHMNNYIRTYESAFGVLPSEINAVGTFYAGGPGASMALAFTDAMWEKYALGEVVELTDPQTDRPAIRNMFYRPQPGDPVRGGAISGIENLQQRGATFLACDNSLGGLSGQLAAAGRGEPAAIADDLRANLLPDIILVPAMAIAIERAQVIGFTYNRW